MEPVLRVTEACHWGYPERSPGLGIVTSYSAQWTQIRSVSISILIDISLTNVQERDLKHFMKISCTLYNHSIEAGHDAYQVSLGIDTSPWLLYSLTSLHLANPSAVERETRVYRHREPFEIPYALYISLVGSTIGSWAPQARTPEGRSTSTL